NNSKVKNLINIDQYILEGIRKIRNLGGNVLKGNIQSLAQRYVDETPSCKVKVTPYFFRSFKKSHNIAFKTLFGESKSAVTYNILSFFNDYEFLKKDYSDHDIFNLDETGLYIKNFGKRSDIVCANDDRKSIKTDKTKITLMLSFNKYGEELTPLIIGKSANPRAFKNRKPSFSIFNTLTIHLPGLLKIFSSTI
ncbi:Tigger transposable element-derived protein 6, partial [Dictyocoela muelleri]